MSLVPRIFHCRIASTPSLHHRRQLLTVNNHPARLPTPPSSIPPVSYLLSIDPSDVLPPLARLTLDEVLLNYLQTGPSLDGKEGEKKEEEGLRKLGQEVATDPYGQSAIATRSGPRRKINV
jgi:hypothetical protein